MSLSKLICIFEINIKGNGVITRKSHASKNIWTLKAPSKLWKAFRTAGKSMAVKFNQYTHSSRDVLAFGRHEAASVPVVKRVL